MFLQIKQYIEWDFYSVIFGMSQGWDLWMLGVKISFSDHAHVAYQIERDDELTVYK